MLLKEAMKNGDYAKAMDLLDGSKLSDEALYAYKIEIYEKTNRTDELRKTLEDYVLTVPQNGFGAIDRLKSLCTPTQWEALRE